MKKANILETILYLIAGLLPLLGYYFLMTIYFKISPFEGYYLIPTIYFIICYLLFPTAGKKLSEEIERSVGDRPVDRLLIPQTKMLMAFLFAPFVAVFSSN